MIFQTSPHDGYVLLVDDEPEIRTIVSRFLERRGFRVRAVPSVRDALDSIGPDLRAALVDVILVNSGGRSGLDVLNAIRERPNGETVPVAMFTGYGFTPEIQATILARGADLLHKPVPLETIAHWLTTKVE